VPSLKNGQFVNILTKYGEFELIYVYHLYKIHDCCRHNMFPKYTFRGGDWEITMASFGLWYFIEIFNRFTPNNKK